RRQWWDQLKVPEGSNERRREDGVDDGEARAELAQVGEGAGRFTAPRSGEQQQQPCDRSHEARSLLPSPAWTASQRATTGEAPVGIEPTNRGFADLCLTTWLRRQGVKSHQNTRVSQPLALASAHCGNGVFRIHCSFTFKDPAR